jgi:nitroreductase
MEFQEVVERRRMVRNYGEGEVAAEVIERIVRNALHAPSAGFSQGWAFLVLDERADVDRFWEATTPAGEGTDGWSTGMRRAPVVIVAMSCKDIYLDRYAEPDKGWTDRDESRWPVPYWDIDTGMAALLMLQTVTDEGLGACFFGVPPEQIPGFKNAFSIPDEYQPIGVITIGTPANDKKSPSLKRGRRGIDEAVHRGTWGHSFHAT